MKNTKTKGYKRVRDPVLKATLKLSIKIVGIIIVVVSIFTFVFGLHRVNDLSMLPNINPQDTILYYRLDHEYLVGETVVYNYKGDIRIGRIVATAGDEVNIDENGLKVNGANQLEPKIFNKTLPFVEGIKFPVKLKENEVFILADARGTHLDSRGFGALNIDQIQGKIFMLFRRSGI